MTPVAASAPGDENGSIVVVGAGPHALTVCAYLLRSRPDWGKRLLVVDPKGWLDAWNATMARLEITVLRSPCVHHPDPAPYALLDFGRSRLGELVGQYQSPTVALFADFCASLVERHGLHDRLLADRVTAIDISKPEVQQLTLASGKQIDAACVIVATNSTIPRIPSWAPHRGVVHASRVEPGRVEPGERIAVVGGGLTAAQLCVAASRRGARVALLTRSALRCSSTDTDPRWLGRARLEPYFSEADWDQRAQAYRAARRGSMPPAWGERLRSAAAANTLELREDVTLTAVHNLPDGLELDFDTGRPSLVVDGLWLATGAAADARADPLLAAVAGPRTTVDGLPIIDAACRFPGTRVYVTGELAALQVGAFAPNLAGARIAAERIVGSLADLPSRQYPCPLVDLRLDVT